MGGKQARLLKEGLQSTGMPLFPNFHQLVANLTELPANLIQLPAGLAQLKADLSNLGTSLPPDPAYKHFRRLAPMFQNEQHDFARDDAAWMADASHLAYFGGAEAQQRVETAGYQHYQFLDLREGTQAHVFSPLPGRVVVAFRGSEVISPHRLEEFVQALVAHDRDSFFHLLLGPLADDFSDAQVLLAPWPLGGRVHIGFSRLIRDPAAPSQVMPELARAIAAAGVEAGGGAPRVWFTGHSLGAALATLAADLHGGQETLYTFGSPRVGDAEFSTGHAKRVPATWRLVHNRDLVTRVPLHGGLGPTLAPTLAYQHVEKAKFIEAGGTVRDPVSLEEVSSAPLGGAETTAAFLMRQLVQPGLPETIGGLVDHGPIFYAKSLWG